METDDTPGLRPYTVEVTFLGVQAEVLAMVYGMPLVDASIYAEPHLVRGTE